MVHGVRASISFTSGLVFGVLLSVLLFLPDELIELRKSDEEPSTDHWEVIIKKAAVTTTNGQSQIRKIIRAGFVATELGIREKLAVILLGQSSLMMALNASIGHYVPHLQVFADISRFDNDIDVPANLILYRLNGQYSHISILNLIFNMHTEIFVEFRSISSFSYIKFILNYARKI
ncbi:Chondroitin sulfate synthase mig-22 [Dirofilaria immitis]